ncbi:MAG: glycosyltransferase family 2 protein [Gammaproteobacteria bacterium]|jgi:GT2 family glycosyltransferase|nr:glycosyltransferase family 2 protein [Gammaproteobacteria bacterium]
MNHPISIILPNYNGASLLEKNLPSLLEAIDGFEHEIIVIDDCSSDNSVSFLEQSYPDITVIQNEVNLGFSATCNKGIRAARLELLCVVNTDVTFTPDYFTKATKEFDDASLFAVKGDIINYNSSFEDVINIDRTILLYYKRGFLRFDTKTPLTKRTLISGDIEQFVGLGCCFVCRREQMLELGGFDEIYSPFYWEDGDLGLRAVQKGFNLLYLPEAKVFHQASSTISNYRSHSQRRLVSNRNKFLFTWRHLDKKRLWLSHAPVTLLNLLSRWLILDWKYYASFFYAIKSQLQFNR